MYLSNLNRRVSKLEAEMKDLREETDSIKFFHEGGVYIVKIGKAYYRAMGAKECKYWELPESSNDVPEQINLTTNLVEAHRFKTAHRAFVIAKHYGGRVIELAPDFDEACL